MQPFDKTAVTEYKAIYYFKNHKHMYIYPHVSFLTSTRQYTLKV